MAITRSGKNSANHRVVHPPSRCDIEEVQEQEHEHGLHVDLSPRTLPTSREDHGEAEADAALARPLAQSALPSVKVWVATCTLLIATTLALSWALAEWHAVNCKAHNPLWSVALAAWGLLSGQPVANMLPPQPRWCELATRVLANLPGLLTTATGTVALPVMRWVYGNPRISDTVTLVTQVKRTLREQHEQMQQQQGELQQQQRQLDEQRMFQKFQARFNLLQSP